MTSEPSPAPAPTAAGGPRGSTAPGGVSREQRPHPATPMIRGWILLLAVLIYLAREFLPNGSRGGPELPPLQWIFAAVGLVVILVAAGSFVTWWFTRYVVDDTELRIETGMLTKRSRKIAFERIQSVDLIQPLAARLFQLAELRIEVGGAEAVRIRYLKRVDAARMRDFLLHRAHGDRGPMEADRGDSDALFDRSSRDHPIVTVSPAQLITGFLLSVEFLLVALILVAAVTAAAVAGFILYALPGLIPGVIGLFSLVSRRLITQFNFTLADTGRGLRITRGLTNLTSQSLPIDRIQGLRISQDFLWRLAGWYRVEVDVLGYDKQGQGENKSDASSLLLPVATGDQLRMALRHCLSGADHEAVTLHPLPRRARWLRWWNHWTIRYGVNDALAVNEIGWLFRRVEIVPHAKTQSVRAQRGPLQRLLRVATVHIDTTKGPVNWSAPHLPEDVAGAFVRAQLDRARAARAAVRTTAHVQPIEGPQPRDASQPTTVSEVLADPRSDSR